LDLQDGRNSHRFCNPNGADLAKLFSGEFSIPMDVRSFPVEAQALEEQQDLRRLLLKWLGGEQSVKVDLGSNPLPEFRPRLLSLSGRCRSMGYEARLAFRHTVFCQEPGRAATRI
jgi:hypothetical protein